MKRLFELLRQFSFLLLAILFSTGSPKSEESTPLKVYIRDSLYGYLKKALPAAFPLKEESQRHLNVFQKRSIEWIPLSGSELYSRLKQEEDHPLADVVVGVESEDISEMKGASFPADIRENLYLPFQWKNESFLPLYYGYLAIFYNTQKISIPSQSLWEFVSVRTDESLVFPDPRVSTIGFCFVDWLIESLPHAKQGNWEIFKSKIKNMPSSWEIAYSLFRKGEASLMVAYTTIMAGKDSHIKAVFFPEGNPIHIFVAFKTLKAAQDPDADEVLRFLISENIQKLIAHELRMYPVWEDAIPQGFINLPKPDKIFMPHLTSRQEILDRWKKIMGK